MRIQTKDFNLEATLESGQVFGFTKNDKNVYCGIIQGACVELSRCAGDSRTAPELNVRANSKTITPRMIRDYFDLDRDLSPVRQTLKEEGLWETCEKIQGLRLIRQDHWEALACFILSSNNNVKRIQGIWHNLSEYYSRSNSRTAPMIFPTARQIASSHEKILRSLGLGYRAPFLLRTSQFVSKNPQYLQWIHEADYEEAKARVIAFPGIGEKVADCALLYGFQKYEAFPVDVWILRVMRKLYFKNRKVSEEKVHAFAQKRWGPNAGYIQQYLFHGARTGIL